VGQRLHVAAPRLRSRRGVRGGKRSPWSQPETGSGWKRNDGKRRSDLHSSKGFEKALTAARNSQYRLLKKAEMVGASISSQGTKERDLGGDRAGYAVAVKSVGGTERFKRACLLGGTLKRGRKIPVFEKITKGERRGGARTMIHLRVTPPRRSEVI